MKLSMKICALGIAVIALSAAGFAVIRAQQGTAKQIFHSKNFAYSFPSGATQQDRDNFFHNVIYGTSNSTTLTLDENIGEVKGTLTGLVMVGTNERQLTVTILAPTAGVQQARTYVNNQLVATATVANGGIIVRSGMALATMSILIPPAGTTYTVEAQWDPTTGPTRSQAVTGPN